MNKLSKFFELIGTQPNVKFKLKNCNNGIIEGLIYWFDEAGNVTCNIDNYFTLPSVVPKILSGKYKIVPEPFVPNIRQEYYYINREGVVNTTTYQPSYYDSDILKVIVGNCFPTSDVTKEQYDAIKEKFRSVGVPVGNWEYQNRERDKK